MYKCLSCGTVFEEPLRYKEYSEAWGRPVYEEWAVCPRCYDADFEEYSEEDEYEEDEEEC